MIGYNFKFWPNFKSLTHNINKSVETKTGLGKTGPVFDLGKSIKVLTGLVNQKWAGMN